MAEIEQSGSIRVYDRAQLLIAEFSGFPSDETFAAYLTEFERIMDVRVRDGLDQITGKPVDLTTRNAVLYDTTDSTHAVTGVQRRMQVDFMRRMKEKHGDEGAENVGVCFVIKNGIVRGVLTALMWLNPMQKETIKVVATREEADAWCRRWILDIRGGSLHPHG